MEGFAQLLDDAHISRKAAAKVLKIQERRLYRAFNGAHCFRYHEEWFIWRFRKVLEQLMAKGQLPGHIASRHKATVRNSKRILELDLFK